MLRAWWRHLCFLIKATEYLDLFYYEAAVSAAENPLDEFVGDDDDDNDDNDVDDGDVSLHEFGGGYSDATDADADPGGMRDAVLTPTMRSMASPTVVDDDTNIEKDVADAADATAGAAATETNPTPSSRRRSTWHRQRQPASSSTPSLLSSTSTSESAASSRQQQSTKPIEKARTRAYAYSASALPPLSAGDSRRLSITPAMRAKATATTDRCWQNLRGDADNNITADADVAANNANNANVTANAGAAPGAPLQYVTHVDFLRVFGGKAALPLANEAFRLCLGAKYRLRHDAVSVGGSRGGVGAVTVAPVDCWTVMRAELEDAVMTVLTEELRLLHSFADYEGVWNVLLAILSIGWCNKCYCFRVFEFLCSALLCPSTLPFDITSLC
jgi:hypothetical protein